MSLEDCTDIVVSWAKRQASRPRRPPRQNVRLLLGSADLATRVREILEAASDEDAWYIVRASADPDAVRQRHGRSQTRPPGVTESTPLLYLVFWTPGVSAHDANAQSLADLDAVDVRQLLDDPEDFRLPLEAQIEEQCDEAAAAWPTAKRPLAAEHLRAAWGALRAVLRKRAGGKERSLPFVTQLEEYVGFLRAARMPEALWSATPTAERPLTLTRAWGEALPSLGMFRMPALGDHLGIGLDRKLSEKINRELLERDLWNMLAENLDAATDHQELGDKIAGKSSLAERLKDVPVALAQDDNDGARRALYDFCTERDESALGKVEWLFRKEPGKKRSESQGLKGLLIQRGARHRRDPLERVVADTAQLLQGIVTSQEAKDAAQQLVDSRRVDVHTSKKNASRVANELSTLAAGSIPESFTDSTLRAALDEALQACRVPATACESTARAWRAIAGNPETAISRERSLLLGTLRVCAQHGEPISAGSQIALRVFNTEGTTPVGNEHVLGVTTTGTSSLQKWFRDTLAKLAHPQPEDGEENEEDDAGEEDGADTSSIQVQVAVAKGKERAPLGQFLLSWREKTRLLLGRTRQDTIRSWSATSAKKQSPWTELVTLFSDAGQPVNEIPPDYVKAWFELHQAIGTDANAELAAGLGPLPAPEAKAVVDTWSALLARAGAPDTKAQRDALMKEIENALTKNDAARAMLLMEELKSVGSDSKEALTQPQTRACLEAMTGVLHRDGARTLYLTPYHPLVLRLRVLAEETLWSCLATLIDPSTEADIRRAIIDAAHGWGLPEPSLMYGGFWEGQPLAFDSWITDWLFSRFVPHEPAIGADVEKIGVGSVHSTIEHYLALHPASRDRLALRALADPDGRWAWRLVTSLVEEEDIAADVALVSTRNLREPTFFERGAHATELRRLLEMSDNGHPPRIRFRREPEPDRSAHVAVVVGTSASVFLPRLETLHCTEEGLLPTWSAQRLFEAPRWETHNNGLVSGRPRFEIEWRLARAITFGAKGGTDIFVERVSIDPSVVREPISKLHEHAHWLVVVTRHPVHNVIESAGDDVAMLLDFRSRNESGRPLHICTSMGRDQLEFDLQRLRSALTRLLGFDVDDEMAERVIRSARRFAPGTAMTCTGTTSIAHVKGLVGLLVTRAVVATENACTLPIDQHSSLLSSGPSDTRSDILVVEDTPSELRLRVIESKVTASDPEGAVPRGRDQVVQTTKKLAHFERTHALILRTREDLARAIDVQAEIAAQPRMRSIARAVRDAGRPMRISPMSEHEVHIWSLVEGVSASTTGDAKVPRCVVHPRTELLKRLDAL